MRERRGADVIFVGKYERKRTTGRPRLTWKDNMKTDLKEIK
jgi:hypothetical protein